MRLPSTAAYDREADVAAYCRRVAHDVVSEHLGAAAVRFDDLSLLSQCAPVRRV
jgi:hypothetical protein